jgi:hypothetical protein
MHLIGFKAYQKGFFGCLETEDDYRCFLFSKNTLRVVTTYAKEDFTCRNHFLATLHKFLPRHFFLSQPVPVTSLEARDLLAVARRLTPNGAGKTPIFPYDRALAGQRWGRGDEV